MEKKSEILFTEVEGIDGNLGLITLNRPEVMNALNQAMFVALGKHLKKWAADSHIKAVVIQAAEGRAFCAGGDIRSAYERKLENDPTLPDFFGEEYRLNKCIYHFPKPYIALMDGITMGGGVGISIHGSHRVATERFVFAMPETRIGFYPDIGASYFLSRLPHKIGLYLGLTGARLAYNDCLELGIVNHVVARDSFPKIIELLAQTSLDKHADATVSELINQFTRATEKSNFMFHQTEIQTCFSKKTVETIIDALEHYPSAWCEEVTNMLILASPTSLKVTLRQLQEGEKLTFDDCMKLEYRLTNRFLKSHDFFEGVRAAIIDKDNKPQWQPAALGDVKAEDIDLYFAPLSKELI
ncbi:MAG: enoyl-CoA hydratase/isomerase family protein [Gammaproteobacteria bacterium]|nr:enoyl-CoA hydratase/isomerase family protein [Gammaproteobacteria bacterium]